MIFSSVSSFHVMEDSDDCAFSTIFLVFAIAKSKKKIMGKYDIILEQFVKFIFWFLIIIYLSFVDIAITKKKLKKPRSMVWRLGVKSQHEKASFVRNILPHIFPWKRPDSWKLSRNNTSRKLSTRLIRYKDYDMQYFYFYFKLLVNVINLHCTFAHIFKMCLIAYMYATCF